ncbi:MAG: hypothetical protein R2843_05570 [Thermomicrobiales bacterium]
MFDTVKRAAEFGINVDGNIAFDYDVALKRSLGVVDKQYKGLLYLFDKKHKIPVFMGRGRLLDKNTVGVTPNDEGEEHHHQHRFATAPDQQRAATA